MTTRIVTGAVIAVLALLVVAHGGFVFFFLMVALGFFGLNEFYRLTRRYRPIPLAGFAALIAMLCAAWFGSARGALGGIALAVLLAALGGLLIGPKPGVTVRVAMTLLGVIYIGLGFSALLLLRHVALPGMSDGGAWLVGMTVFGTWGGDTVAYFVGKGFGHVPMAPALSPKKTWEGFAGGALGTILLVVFVGFMMGYRIDGWSAGAGLMTGAVIAVVGPLGDLFESLIKRDVQIKDSGRGLPGHGGVLGPLRRAALGVGGGVLPRHRRPGVLAAGRQSAGAAGERPIRRGPGMAIRQRLLTAAALALAAAAFAFTWYRLFFGCDLNDEAFSVLIPWRWALGDRPFVDEMDWRRRGIPRVPVRQGVRAPCRRHRDEPGAVLAARVPASWSPRWPPCRSCFCARS